MSLRLGVWSQLLADRCKLLGIETPQDRPDAERVEALRLRAWEVERSISSAHSEDSEGDALIWLVSKYAVSAGGRSFTAAWVDLADELWGAEQVPQPANAAPPPADTPPAAPASPTSGEGVQTSAEPPSEHTPPADAPTEGGA